ncbi:MAG: bifunctional (p)ppGpp synthetase/guanosine-3',5'-bis(diphosphate) 3'-pyrophosphohydrolase [Bacilli bacterium]|nr:bifunctional (p)ppGpp synthetase/guanosine-3',5'-bis(diphosphate) 3'-pyrophosphohydrolase [Bacilli bacterium]
MSHRVDTITFDDVKEKIKTYITDKNELKNIEKAYKLAEEKHEGQYRKSGEPYIVHPLNVAMILTTIYADSETLQAALLHDVLEDCDCTREEMESLVGPNVTKLVEGVTKISRLHFSTENEYLIEYYKKIIVGMSEDVRVIIVKLADRLHNMRTLWALPEEKQKKIAREALEILAPIGDHLGIHKIKSELEDLSLRYLKKDVFYDIAERLNKTKVEREYTVREMMQSVTDLLNEHNIHHEILGRAKSIYSIYKKLNKGKKFTEIFDLSALRILVDTPQDCYMVLGIIHSKYRPMPKRFKDYIAMPKTNMYQSLHTTVFGIGGYLFEIQIRTYEMDEIAENGIASHWAYKEKKDVNATKSAMQTSTEQKLQFFKSIIDLKNEKLSSEDFVNVVRDEVLNNNIYCFTPKGDVIELPKDATPIDFAYKIHTKVGETTTGAIVNNNIVTLDYKLQDGDIVKIITNKSSTPSQEWINIVKSTTTKNKIKAFFAKSEKEVYIERGKDTLEKELRKRKLAFNTIFSQENLKTILTTLKLDTLEDIYLNVGNNKITPNSVINIIDKVYEEKEPPKKVFVENKDKETDIIVSGIDKVKVNLANCCNPIYGDEIIGYITKGNGISIHRVNCHNLETIENRIVDVKWNNNTNKKYLCELLIHSNTLDDHIVDIIQRVTKPDVTIDGIKTMSKTNVIVYNLSLYVRSVEQLNILIFNLEKEPYITNVERVFK